MLNGAVRRGVPPKENAFRPTCVRHGSGFVLEPRERTAARRWISLDIVAFVRIMDSFEHSIQKYSARLRGVGGKNENYRRGDCLHTRASDGCHRLDRD